MTVSANEDVRRSALSSSSVFAPRQTKWLKEVSYKVSGSKEDMFESANHLRVSATICSRFSAAFGGECESPFQIYVERCGEGEVEGAIELFRGCDIWVEEKKTEYSQIFSSWKVRFVLPRASVFAR